MGSLKINAGATSLKYIETFYSFGIQDNYILDRTKSQNSVKHSWSKNCKIVLILLKTPQRSRKANRLDCEFVSILINLHFLM